MTLLLKSPTRVTLPLCEEGEREGGRTAGKPITVEDERNTQV
jgi:hypothetical protein